MTATLVVAIVCGLLVGLAVGAYVVMEWRLGRLQDELELDYARGRLSLRSRS